MTPEQRIIMNLQRDVDFLKRHTQNIPSRWSGGSTGDKFFVINNIVGGSALWTSGGQTITGIKHDFGTSVTTVPNVNPSIPSIGTFATGLGRGILSGNFVYVCLRPDPGTGVVTGLQASVPNQSLCLSYGKVSLPLVSDSSVLVTVYLLNRF